MGKISVNFIGCGKLGKTIAKLLKQNDVANVIGIVNSSITSAREAAHFIGESCAFSNIKELPKADIYFITTRDDLIEETAINLQTNVLLYKGAIILHCGGSLSSDELKIVKNSQCYIASIHPIKSFAHPSQSISTFPGTYCVIEGDEQATTVLTQLFEKIGGIMLPIKKENKKIYHAGGIIANNYLVTLHYHATQCYINAGINETIAKKLVSMLMQDALSNLDESSHEKSLTGPIQRGDANTVLNHTLSLRNSSLLKETKDIYLSMGRGTLPLTSHSQIIKEKFFEMLSSSKDDCPTIVKSIMS